MPEALNNAVGERIAGSEPQPSIVAAIKSRPISEIVAELLPVSGVAELTGCSTRHVHRLADAGKMPAPVRLGALVRWRRAEILGWIAQGCPPVRNIGRAAR